MASQTKRKFIGNIKVDFNINEIDKNNDYGKKPSEIDFEVYTKAFIQTEDNIIIQGFVHLVDGKPIIIPEPEPSILYFTNAENKLSELIKLLSIILESKLFGDLNHLSHIFFNFFQLSSDYIINLFTSIEAYNNSLIPDDFEILHNRKIFNKERTQRSMDFLSKLKKAIPKIMDKSFANDFPEKYEFILELKKLRDNVVHTKNMQNGFLASYRELYRSYLDFDFIKSYQIIREYFNYYREDWIEECNCDK